MPPVEHWPAYYAKADVRPASEFAHWCEPLFPERARVLDLGCGDGRDSLLFAERGHSVTALDACPEALSKFSHPNIRKECALVEHVSVLDAFDVVYMRWFLHAIPESAENVALHLARQTGGLIFMEARSANGDDPGGHYRRLIDLDALIAKLKGTCIFYAAESKGWSVEGDDDPLLLRVMTYA